MVKTTIDGLAVRTSEKKKANVTRSSTRRVEHPSPAPAKRTTGRKTSKRAAVRANDDFLQPVQGFDFDEIQTKRPQEEAEDAPVDNKEVDWSDLLDEMGDHEGVKSETERLDPLLAAWDDELPEDEPPRKGRSKHKKKKHKVLRVILILLLLLIVGGGVVFYVWGDQIISRLTNGQSGLLDTFTAMMSDAKPLATDRHGRTNVLIFGTEGYDMNGTAGDGVHDGAELTDSLMVISLDQETKDVALLSIPRDLKVTGACMVGKINEVFSCNNQQGTNEEAGAKALMKQVGMVLGIDLQYWAHVNWASLIQIIDTLGGITVTLDEDINDYYYTGVVAHAGVPLTVNGEQALGLARARHGTTGGDFTRGNSQQKIVEGIVQKVLDNGLGLTEAFNLLNILGDNLRTNFSSDYIKTGLQLAKGFDVAQIRQIPLVDYENNVYYVEATMINEVSYVLPKDGNDGTNGTVRLQNYLREMLSNNPAVREHATMAVFNATDRAGVAGAEKTRLEADGYQVLTVGDAEADDCNEVYCVYAMKDGKPATTEALAQRYNTTVRSAAELPTDVWPGEADFAILVGQAPETN